MTIKINSKDLIDNVIPFKNFQKKKQRKYISSSIAAIIAVKINHQDNQEPEDSLIDYLEQNENIEILAFEDALDTISDNLSSVKSSTNFLNDA